MYIYIVTCTCTCIACACMHSNMHTCMHDACACVCVHAPPHMIIVAAHAHVDLLHMHRYGRSVCQLVRQIHMSWARIFATLEGLVGCGCVRIGRVSYVVSQGKLVDFLCAKLGILDREDDDDDDH
jgi:hypothetical protein